MIKKKNILFSLMKTMCVALILVFTTAVGVIAFNTPKKESQDEKEILSVEINNDNDEDNIQLAQSLDERKVLTEKIEVVTEEIPYEVISKDGVREDSSDVQVIKKGQNGTKETTYKVAYENDTEVSKEEISSEVTKEAVNKVIAKKSVAVVSRSTDSSRESSTSIASSVSGEPVVKVMNCSAYTAYEGGKAVGSSGFGRTASGAYVQQWYTIAAGKSLPFGTKVYIPYFKDKPNGGWFVVQDRGGAISDNRIDIYMPTKAECTSFGRRNLECYIYYTVKKIKNSSQ